MPFIELTAAGENNEPMFFSTEAITLFTPFKANETNVALEGRWTGATGAKSVIILLGNRKYLVRESVYLINEKINDSKD